MTDKPFYFFDLFLHFGVSLSPDGMSAMYGTIGGALVYHSEDDDEGLSPSPGGSSPTTASGVRPNYYLATTIGAFMFGAGARYCPLSRVVLNAEYKWVYNSTSEFKPVEGQPGWFYAGGNTSKLDPIGIRVTIGVSYVLSIGE